MIWFGSSSGVAISNMYPEAKSVGQWIRHGWHVGFAYVLGFFAMFFFSHWHPDNGVRDTAGARRVHGCEGRGVPGLAAVREDCSRPERSIERSKDQRGGASGRERCRA